MDTYRIIPTNLAAASPFYVVMTDAAGDETHGTHQFPSPDAAQSEIERLKALGLPPL